MLFIPHLQEKIFRFVCSSGVSEPRNLIQSNTFRGCLANSAVVYTVDQFGIQVHIVAVTLIDNRYRLFIMNCLIQVLDPRAVGALIDPYIDTSKEE